MEHLTESKREIGHKSPKGLTTKDVISEVKNIDSIELVTANCKKGNRNPSKQQTEGSLKIRNNQRESSFDFQKSMWKCRTFGNWRNIAFGQGLFTLTEMAKTT